MEIGFTLPLDEGFLRRECPACERQFKWFSDDTDNRPDDAEDPDVYFCPYCGVTATHDEWWTPAHLEYASGMAAGPVIDKVTRTMEDALKPLNKSGFVTGTVRGETAPAPDELHEPNDMVVVEPPCHYWEPLKVDEEWTDPFFCLVCGHRFVV